MGLKLSLFPNPRRPAGRGVAPGRAGLPGACPGPSPDGSCGGEADNSARSLREKRGAVWDWKMKRSLSLISGPMIGPLPETSSSFSDKAGGGEWNCPPKNLTNCPVAPPY